VIKCVIIDDEQHAIDVLQSHIAQVPALELSYATTNPVEAFQFVQQHHADLIFLDIQMPELDGLQFLKLLNEKSKVILTTAYSEHALEGFEHNVTDYLLKPVLFDRFLKAVKRIISQPENEGLSAGIPSQKEFLFIKTGVRNKMVKVLINDIHYIESKGNYLEFVTDAGKIMTLLTLKELENELPRNLFVRIHNSYLAAVNRIAALEGNRLKVGNDQLPIGATYRRSVLDLLDEHIIKRK